MATKVFLRFNRDIRDVYVKGREYEVLQQTDGLIRAKSELGIEFFDFETNKKYFDVIEREDSTTFEANGHTWTRHTPGDPMPCEGGKRVSVLCGSTTHLIANVIAANLDWRSGPGTIPIIAWRYHEERKQPVGDDWVSVPAGQAVIARDGVPSVVFDDDLSEPIFGIPVAIDWHQWRSTGVWIGKARTADEDESERNDLIVAVEDSTLTPSQRRHWEEMEAKQAAREQLKHDAETKALQDRADQLADAGRAMDRVDQDHSHKLGWRK